MVNWIIEILKILFQCFIDVFKRLDKIITDKSKFINLINK